MVMRLDLNMHIFVIPNVFNIDFTKHDGQLDHCLVVMYEVNISNFIFSLTSFNKFGVIIGLEMSYT